MKLSHITKYIFAVVVISIFTGCQTSTKEPNQINEAPLDRRIGVIRSLGGAVTTDSGTHLLTLDTGDTIFLKSTVVDLNDPKYTEKTVEVRGNITYIYNGKALMNVMNIDIIDQNYLPQEEETLKWENYSNEESGFSNKYHTSYQISEANSFVEFIKEIDADKDEKFVVKISREATDAISLVDYLGLANDEPATLLAAGYVKSRVGTQSIPALKKQLQNQYTFLLKGGSYVYEISYVGIESNESLLNENIFFDIVSSFTLINEEDLIDDNPSYSQDEAISSPSLEETFLNDPISEETKVKAPEQINIDIASLYTSLESETFDFAMMYPKNWYYAGSSPIEQNSIRHYAFDSKPLEDGNTPLISLDIFSGSSATGDEMIVNGTSVFKEMYGDKLILSVVKGNRIYKISGTSAQENVMFSMAGSIK
jgi:hypothetical protein